MQKVEIVTTDSVSFLIVRMGCETPCTLFSSIYLSAHRFIRPSPYTISNLELLKLILDYMVRDVNVQAGRCTHTRGNRTNHPTETLTTSPLGLACRLASSDEKVCSLLANMSLKLVSIWHTSKYLQSLSEKCKLYESFHRADRLSVRISVMIGNCTRLLHYFWKLLHDNSGSSETSWIFYSNCDSCTWWTTFFYRGALTNLVELKPQGSMRSNCRSQSFRSF